MKRRKIVMAKVVPLSEQDEKGIDRKFWRRVGAEGRFSAAWEMLREVSLIRGGDGRQPRLQRSVEKIQRAPR